MKMGNTNISEQFLDSLLGLSIENAMAKCEANNYSSRITKRDNDSFVVTMDMRFDRINFHVSTSLREYNNTVHIDEVVVKATVG
jgi:hypothetical protein